MESTINERFYFVLKHCIDSGKAKNKADFAQNIGIKASRLSEITGNRMGISTEICNSLHEKYGINMNWMISEDGNMINEQKNDSIQIVDQTSFNYLLDRYEKLAVEKGQLENELNAMKSSTGKSPGPTTYTIGSKELNIASEPHKNK